MTDTIITDPQTEANLVDQRIADAASAMFAVDPATNR